MLHPLPVVLTALCILAAIVLAGSVWTDRRATHIAAKLGASAAMVALAGSLGAQQHEYGRWILAGLMLSAVGDALLLSSRERWFLGGLAAFLLAHVAYIVAFHMRPLSLVAWCVAAAAMALVIVAVGRWLWPRLAGFMRVAVGAYLIVIGAMVACAVAVAAASLAGWPATLAAVSAIAFAASDLSVARDRFVAPGRINGLWGLPLYYAAQIGLAWSALVP